MRIPIHEPWYREWLWLGSHLKRNNHNLKHFLKNILKYVFFKAKPLRKGTCTIDFAEDWFHSHHSKLKCWKKKTLN